jgi:peptidoglycan/LPS O-acetylase OafA/YrhL
MLDAFAIGIGIARLHLDGTAARWTRHRAIVPLLAIAVGFAVASHFVWDVYWKHATYWTYGGMVVFWRTGLALTFGALVLLAAGLPDLTRATPLRPLNYLGEISYGIYLWHLPVILAVKQIFPSAAPVTILWATLVVVIALSATTWHFIERPCIRRFR